MPSHDFIEKETFDCFNHVKFLNYENPFEKNKNNKRNRKM